MTVTLEDTLRRLKRDRDHADRRYNEALTELDRSVRPPVSIPEPESALDEHKLPALNESWNILPTTPDTSGVKGRLAGFIWRIIGPYLQRQLTFNATLVEHVNRDADARRAAHRRDREALAAIRSEMQQLTAFQGRLLVLLQQITPYVDTKDREAVSGMHVLNKAVSGLAESQDKYRESIAARELRYQEWTHSIARRQDDLQGMFAATEQSITGFNAVLSSLADAQGKFRETLEARERRYHTRTSDIANAQGELKSSTHALNVALSAISDAYAKYRESLESREHRYEARTTAIAAAQEDLRSIVSLNQQAISAIKRILEEGVEDTKGTKGTNTNAEPGSGAGADATAFGTALDAYKYIGFEDQFRGSTQQIRERLESYVKFFANGPSGDVLDVGCGRGEFLDLLGERGIRARGIDSNHEMAEVCRARGLDVSEVDAVTHLAGLPDGSLSGIFAAQVVEHLDPAYLLRFLDLAFQKLQPRGRLVLETINPACWTAFFESYLRDITHRCALHPETLKFLALASGFSRADLELRSPVPPQDRLQPVAIWEGADEPVRDLAEAFNGNVEKLNARMFTHMDYALIAQKG
jgi:O-antigen chain-terminating methyltransferase